MRQLRRNKQKMFYALYTEDVPIYATEDEGNILTTEVDGEPVQVVDSYVSGYAEAVEFKANISFDSGETRMAEYGLNVGDYNAVISADKGILPFDEQTLIWHNSEPEYNNGVIVPESADYRVIAIKTSLNEERFILKKRVDD
jgi:hypothetical protein